MGAFSRLATLRCLLALWGCFCSTRLTAQGPASDWENLQLVQKGQRIQVVETDLKSWWGKYLRVNDSETSLLVDKSSNPSQEKTIPRSSVLRVSVLSRTRNTLIGLGIGGVAGGAVAAGLAQQIDKGYGGAISKEAIAATMLTTCGGLGALIGYNIPSQRTLYRSAATAANSGREVTRLGSAGSAAQR